MSVSSSNQPIRDSSIFSKIQSCHNPKYLERDNVNMDDTCGLHNYRLEFDDYSRLVYVDAEIHVDSLDKGSDFPPESIHWAPKLGLPGDFAAQLIGKQLGGPGILNNFLPLNSKVRRLEFVGILRIF